MKILHVTPSLSQTWGGPSRVIKDLTESLYSKGIHNTICATTGHRVGTIRHSELIELKSKTRLVPTQALSTFWTGYSSHLPKTLLDEIKLHDLVHIHELWHFPHFAAYWGAKKAGKPYCISTHGHLSQWALNHKKIRKQIYLNVFQKKAMSKASALHAITQEEAQNIRRLGISNDIRLIPNGIHANACVDSVNSSDFLAMHPSLQGKPVLLFLGRIHPIKGLDLLVDAFKLVLNRYPETHLVIAGPDENGYKQHIEDQLKGNETYANCIFTGLLSERDKLKALKLANILVLPSYSEVMGIATLEGMDAGLPVVITEGCQFPEVAENGAGLVVQHTSTSLSDAILYLLDNPQIRKKMGQIGQQLISQTYNWSTISDSYIDLYADILRSKYE